MGLVTEPAAIRRIRAHLERRGKEARAGPWAVMAAPGADLPVERPADSFPAMLRLMRIALALTVLTFLPGLREDFEDPKAVVVRAAGLAALAGLLASARRLRAARPGALDVALLALLMVEVLATGLARAPLLGVFGEPMQREGLFTSLALAGVFLAARAGTRSPADLEHTLDVALAVVTASSLYALLQAARIDPVPWLPQSVSGAPEGRPFGTLGHPNLLGAMSAAAAVAAFARFAAGGRGRWPALLAAAVCGAATLVTLSRAAWLGGLAGVVVVVILLARTGAFVRPPRAALIGAAVTVALGGALLAFSGWGGKLATRFGELIHPVGGSSAARLEIWRAAVAAWRARPILGHGPDSFAVVFPRFQTPEYWRWEWGVAPFHAHSLYLQLLATRGISGLLVFVAAVIALGACGVAAWRRAPGARPALVACGGALAALAVAGAFGAIGLSGALFVTLLAGSVATLGSPAAGTEARMPARTEDAPRPPGDLAPRAVAVAAGLAALLLGIGDRRASRAAAAIDVWLARAATARPERAAFARARALESARSAARLAPFDDGVARMHAEALLVAAEAEDDPRAALEQATTAARRALALAPERGINVVQLARVQTARDLAGDPAAAAAAAAAFRRFPALMPYHALALDEVARLELRSGRAREARAMMEHVVAVYPDDSVSLLILARACVALGDRPAAVDALRRALAGVWRGQPDSRDVAARALAELAGP